MVVPQQGLEEDFTHFERWKGQEEGKTTLGRQKDSKGAAEGGKVCPSVRAESPGL